MALYNAVFDESKEGVSPSGGKKSSRARIVAITSGKGGVGKTNISTNLGIALASLKKKVCVFDADMGLANINILIGKNPDYTLEDILSDDKDISQVLMDGPGGIKIVPASSGLDKIVELEPQKKEKLISAFEEIEREFDYILIDTSAGISPTVISFVQSAQDAVVVVSPEPTSLTDGYSLIKVLKSKGFSGNIYLLVNMVLSYEDSIKIFNRFNAATKKHLSFEIKYLGHVMMDQGLIASVIQQKPIMILSPESIASRCFSSIARKFESLYAEDTTASFSEYWKIDSHNKEKTDRKGIVTPPKEVREKLSKPQVLSLEELINKASHIIGSGDCSEEKARESIQKLEYSFTKKFDKLPYDMKTALYSSLEFSNFSEGNIKELNQFLESLYEKTYKRPLHNIRDTFIQLLEESRISEEKMKIILQLVENSFLRRFKKSIYDFKEILETELDNKELVEDDFKEIVEKTKERYLDRFGVPCEKPILFPEILETELDKKELVEDNFKEIIEKVKERYLDRFGIPYEVPTLFPAAEVEEIFKKMDEYEQEFDALMNRASGLSRKREESKRGLINILKKLSDET